MKSANRMYKGRSFTKNKDGYFRNGVAGTLHRLIYADAYGEIPKGLEIDHINGIRDDNRIENLQAVSHKQNVQRSSYGMVESRNSRYRALRMVNGINYNKTFDTRGGALMYCNTCFL
jgi:hypothetical protein